MAEPAPWMPKLLYLRPWREVAAALQAAVHQHRVPGRRRQQQLSAGLGQDAHLLGEIGAGALKDPVEALAGREPGADRPVRRGGHRDGADVHDLHALAGDDELPARGHAIVPGVLQVVARGDQTGDDDLVVAPLRKAQTEAGQLDALGDAAQVGFARHAQIDLGIDQRHRAGGLRAPWRSADSPRRRRPGAARPASAIGRCRPAGCPGRGRCPCSG